MSLPLFKRPRSRSRTAWSSGSPAVARRLQASTIPLGIGNRAMPAHPRPFRGDARGELQGRAASDAEPGRDDAVIVDVSVWTLTPSEV